MANNSYKWSVSLSHRQAAHTRCPCATDKICDVSVSLQPQQILSVFGNIWPSASFLIMEVMQVIVQQYVWYKTVCACVGQKFHWIF